jgi:pantoate--beta-alanine ligase
VTGEAGVPPGFGALPEGAVAREADGLVSSPANVALTPEERRAAPGLFRAVLAGQLLHALGEKNPVKILKAVHMALETEPLLNVEALVLLDGKTREPVEKKVTGPVVLVAVVKVGSVFLTDSVRFG